jgi:Tfp pilus assembly protein PilO
MISRNASLDTLATRSIRYDALIIQWMLVGVAVLVAGAAFASARRLSKRLDRDRESYWDLRYEFGQLQARVTRLEADRADRAAPAPAPPPGGADAFVPLSSLKR